MADRSLGDSLCKWFCQAILSTPRLLTAQDLPNVGLSIANRNLSDACRSNASSYSAVSMGVGFASGRDVLRERICIGTKAGIPPLAASFLREPTLFEHTFTDAFHSCPR